MAVAISLLDICRINKRGFALIHFSTEIKTDLFPADDNYSPDKILDVAETFLSGGTDFEKPLSEAVRLVENGALNKPDIVFITDGECKISDDFKHSFTTAQNQYGFKITGILLDQASCCEFSLQDFCDDIHRTSDLCRDDIVQTLIQKTI